jgi:protein-tyrosine phosphatase
VIDLHCHLLPGIDDGPETLEDALAMARVAAAGGTRTIVTTPHVSARYPNDAERIAASVSELRVQLRAHSVPLEVFPGAEIALSHLFDLGHAELARLGLGGGEWLLLEPPFSAAAAGIDDLVLELVRADHRVVLAHPERCPAFQREPRVLYSLVDQGVLTSVTAGSLVGRFGSSVRRFAMRLVDAGIVHNVASDAHDAQQRSPSIARELEQAGLSSLREWLTVEVPGAILAGAHAIPPAPEPPVGGRLAQRQWWRRGPLRRASLSR